MSSSDYRKMVILSLSEIITSILPMLVVLIVMIYIGKPEKIFLKPEWAFAATIFFGQSIVKLAQASIKFGEIGRIKIEHFVLVETLLIVFGLVPAMTVLVLIVQGGESGGVPVLFQVSQVLLFVAASIAYVFVDVTSSRMEKT
jgi:O-antigen/teichoic acid export membrane protein